MVPLQRRVAQILGAVVFVANVLVLCGLTYLTISGNVEGILRYIPARFLTPQALLIYMFASVVLLKYGSEEGKTPAAIRVRKAVLSSLEPFKAKNIGEREANEVVLVPIEFDNFPWVAYSREVGSVQHGEEEWMTVVIERRKDPEGICTLCRNIRPYTVDTFLEGLSQHLDHVLERRATAKEELSPKEMEYALSAAVHIPRTFQVYFRIRFYNGANVVEAQHRLDVIHKEAHRGAPGVLDTLCVFVRKTDKGDVVRVT